MITQSKSYSFRLFGFSFLIWKKPNHKKSNTSGGIVKGSCKIVRNRNYISLAMPDGTIIPHQIDLTIESNLNEVATATVKLCVSID